MKRNHSNLFSHSLQTFLCIGLLIASSCTSEFEDSPQVQKDEYIEFSFNTIDSRASVNQYGNGNFTEGDVIGLYISNGSQTEFRKLTYVEGKWMPNLRRSDFGNGELKMTAHYPLVSESETSTSFHIPTNQNAEGYNPADILFAENTLPAGENKSSLNFKHIMHKLVIKPATDLKNAEIKVRTIANGEINLLTGEANVLHGENTFDYITPKKNTDGSLEAIIYPQPTDNYQTNDGLLSIVSNGKESIYKAPEKYNNGSPCSQFEAGKIFTINLSVITPDLNWANKKIWVYGINPPEDAAWKCLFPNLSYTEYLLWKKEYGWYDVNKRNPSNKTGGVPDGMMCWAVSAANLIHWWMDRNKEYIDKYIEQGKYKGPSSQYNFENAKTENKQESEIFQTFLNSFQNEAGNIDEGVNWFIHGIKPISNTMRNPVNLAGYFQDVFPKDIKLATNIAGMGKETFNKTIKDALQNKKAIGFNRGAVRNSHAMVIWGAEFDENGDVSYIYIADNNDRNQFLTWEYGCMKEKVVYKTMPEGGTMTGYTTGQIEAPADDYIPINRLYTLELGTQYWENYFKQAANN
ncbi:IdeS/Mac family cysteine endopeptidase [Phocaeicola sp.]|uniref:fimbrillin family protein n=1 Tax=Phocaeicola sp. TaxID=2773926 RepID=UPI003A922B0C